MSAIEYDTESYGSTAIPSELRIFMQAAVLSSSGPPFSMNHVTWLDVTSKKLIIRGLKSMSEALMLRVQAISSREETSIASQLRPAR